MFQVPRLLWNRQLHGVLDGKPGGTEGGLRLGVESLGNVDSECLKPLSAKVQSPKYCKQVDSSGVYLAVPGLNFVVVA